MGDFLEQIEKPNSETMHTDHIRAGKISDEVAIKVDHVSKIYKLYDRNRDRLIPRTAAA